MSLRTTNAATLHAAPSTHTLRFTVNGQERQMTVQSWVTLLDLLREQLALTGTKKGCDHGQCGACTVLLDGRRINACLQLAVMCDGAGITTVEGLADLPRTRSVNADLPLADLHPLQQAFVARDAFQCGYCTPGQLCSAVGLMNEGQARTPSQVRELMSGNLCRCGAYPQIVQAVCDVALPASQAALPESAEAA